MRDQEKYLLSTEKCHSHNKPFFFLKDSHWLWLLDLKEKLSAIMKNDIFFSQLKKVLLALSSIILDTGSKAELKMLHTHMGVIFDFPSFFFS